MSCVLGGKKLSEKPREKNLELAHAARDPLSVLLLLVFPSLEEKFDQSRG